MGRIPSAYRRLSTCLFRERCWPKRTDVESGSMGAGEVKKIIFEKDRIQLSVDASKHESS